MRVKQGERGPRLWEFAVPPSDTLLINISKITEDNSAGKTNTNTAQQSQKLESCRFFISTSFYICKEVNPPKKQPRNLILLIPHETQVGAYLSERLAAVPVL